MQYADISIDEYLAHRQPMPHLYDVSPQLDPTAFELNGSGNGAGPDIVRLAAAIRTDGNRHTDVRLLTGDGEKYLATAMGIADNLRCDVYLTPLGADIRFVRESSAITGSSWEAVAVDRATGDPARWQLVRPADLPADVPTWFVSAQGRLHQNSGLVTVSLPAGVAFATKATFRDTVYVAARMKPGAGRVSTVAVNADGGRFEIRRFDGAGSRLGGVELATLIHASLDVIHPDVQIPLTWPTDEEGCAALDVELMRLADALNRTIWVPEPPGAAFLLPDCGEFAAVDEVGGPSSWRAYTSRLAEDREPHYQTSVDGRLAPIGEVAATAFPGVPFASVPAGQMEQLRLWYESVVRWDGMFAIDLAVLGDGRLGVLLEDGTALAVSGRLLRTMLRRAGWAGEDLLLLAQPPAQYWDAVLDHAAQLVHHLTVDLWLPQLGAQVSIRPDGALAAGVAGTSKPAWHVVRYSRPEDLDSAGTEGAPLPAALVGPPESRNEAVLADTMLMPAVVVGTYSVDTPPVTETPPTTAPKVPMAPVRTEVAAVVRTPTDDGRAPHAVPWLPPDPVVNRRAIDLYLPTPHAADDVEAWQFPSADLFLLAGRDPLRLAEHRRDGYLLRLHAPPELAVEVTEHEAQAPRNIRERVRDTGSTHLLPLAWLSEMRVTARFDLDGRGGVAARRDIGLGALAIRFEEAEHGIPGLPNDVVHWPNKGQRASLPAYLVVPDNVVSVPHLLHRGFVALSRHKPAFDEGHRLLEVKIRRRRGIDVPATLDTLTGLPIVGRMHDFVGLDVLLSEEDLTMAVLTRAWRYGPNHRPVLTKLNGATMSETILSGTWEFAETPA